jgi:hypothetical protein
MLPRGSSLADLPELVGFFSYSRDDDEAFRGALTALRDGVARELGAQLGRNKRNFRLWQDQEAIAPGKLWESEIRAAVGQSVFFIPIITPRVVNSHYCQLEFTSFLEREKSLDRSDLVFPILYITVPALIDEARWRNDPVLAIVGTRQYIDWRPMRQMDPHTPVVREAIERFRRRRSATPEETRDDGLLGGSLPIPALNRDRPIRPNNHPGLVAPSIASNGQGARDLSLCDAGVTGHAINPLASH